MKNLFLLFFLLFLARTTIYCQYKQLDSNDDEYGEMLAVINEWCDQHFDNCFGWEFVELIQGAKITRIRDGKWKVNGFNRNQGLASWGKGTETYIREYKATVTRIENNTYLVKFKKQEKTILGTNWPECTKSIEL